MQQSVKNKMNRIFTVIGILLLGFGFISLKMDFFKTWNVLSYIFIGIGCGVFGQNIGTIMQNNILKKYPAEEQKMKIELNDERNNTIKHMAKSKAFDAMVYIFGVIMMIFALLGVELTVILLLVGGYLLVVGIMIYYIQKLEKQM